MSRQIHLTCNSMPSSLVGGMSDGTQLSFALKNQEYRCTQVKDRNGNYISSQLRRHWRRSTRITDTLGRRLDVRL